MVILKGGRQAAGGANRRNRSGAARAKNSAWGCGAKILLSINF